MGCTMTITRRAIETARTQSAQTGKPIVLWDDNLKGFGCRVSPSGSAVWLLKKRLGKGGRGSKQVLNAFRDYNEASPTEARAEALKIIAEIRDGIDPAEKTRKTRIVQHSVYQSGKLSDVVDAYIKKHATPGRYWTETARLLNKGLVAKLGKDTLVANVTRSDIRSIIDAKEDATPGAARTLFAAIRHLFKWCASRELIAASPCDGLTPPKNLPSRDRVLADHEVKLFWTALDRMPLIKIGSEEDDSIQHLDIWRPFYRTLLLTAQRRDEVAGMMLSEIDLDKATWTIPKERTKNNKEHLVHLSPQAVSILRGAVGSARGPYVFSSNGETPISGFSKAKLFLDARMQAILDEAGEGKTLKPFRIHDLRRTAASGMAALGFAPHVIERVLNHVSGAQGGLVGIYQRHEYVAERKKAVDAWANHLSGIVSTRKVSSNVIRMR